MNVYVDSARHRLGRMIMCHMIADTTKELHAMAARLDIPFRYFQSGHNPHFDICLSKRRLAIRYGAIEVDRRQLGAILRALNKQEDP